MKLNYGNFGKQSKSPAGMNSSFNRFGGGKGGEDNKLSLGNYRRAKRSFSLDPSMVESHLQSLMKAKNTFKH